MSEPRTALVTGGTRGIGLGIAAALAREGWSLALCGLRPDAEVAGAIASLRDTGSPEVFYLPADVGQPDNRRRLLDTVGARFGGLDALVNNAGRAPRVRADLLEATEESFEEVLRTNLQGPYFLTQAAVPLLAARRQAQPGRPVTIVFVTSISAALVSTNRGEYCVSKAGLSMAASLFAVRLAADGILVYEVRPGITATDMTATVTAVNAAGSAAGRVP